jgi:hypothetical protein
MPKFPTKEADVLALVNQMIAGKQAHPTDFPHIMLPGLNNRRNNYIAARDAQIDAYAAAQLATKEKLEALKDLEDFMKQKLRQAEVDVAGDPEKLAYIGWGPKTEPQPVQAPNMPLNLRIADQDRGAVSLIWDKAANGDEVRNYIIERREKQAGSNNFGPWMIAGSAISNEIELKNQPRFLQLEYRAKATNTGGESPPSNTVAVVL